MSSGNNTVGNTNSAPDINKAPGRTIGMTVMIAMILFTAYWMSQRQSDSVEAGIASNTEELSGFRSDAWQLPDDELLGFVKISAGAFTMGSNPAADRMAYENERWSNLQRQGSVELPDYYIGRYEVTVAQIREWAEESGNQTRGIVVSGEGSFPATQVTWPQALAYARWLERQLKDSSNTPPEILQMLNNGGSVTLPSEAEWEKAARGIDGRIFPWGSSPRQDRANYSESKVLAVGSFGCPECANGLSDMAGTVWELTRSPMQEYPYSSADDFEPASANPLWVMRGGSFSDAANNVRAAVRGAVDSSVRNDTIGFRLVITTL